MNDREDCRAQAAALNLLPAQRAILPRGRDDFFASSSNLESGWFTFSSRCNPLTLSAGSNMSITLHAATKLAGFSSYRRGPSLFNESHPMNHDSNLSGHPNTHARPRITAKMIRLLSPPSPVNCFFRFKHLPIRQLRSAARFLHQGIVQDETVYIPLQDSKKRRTCALRPSLKPLRHL